MAPPVPNYGRPGRGPVLVEGMVLAIEPMLVLGRPETRVLDDDWTVVTADGTWSAHFEHTVAITAAGPWVLTAEDGGRGGFERLRGEATAAAVGSVAADGTAIADGTAVARHADGTALSGHADGTAVSAARSRS